VKTTTLDIKLHSCAMCQHFFRASDKTLKVGVCSLGLCGCEIFDAESRVCNRFVIAPVALQKKIIDPREWVCDAAGVYSIAVLVASKGPDLKCAVSVCDRCECLSFERSERAWLAKFKAEQELSISDSVSIVAPLECVVMTQITFIGQGHDKREDQRQALRLA
jgi:hypothetical protein